MLRLAVALLAIVATCGTADSADRTPAPYRGHRAVGLPAGLPRPHYRFRTTITDASPHSHRPHRLSVYETPAVLYAPVMYVGVPFVAPLVPPWPIAPVVDPYVPYWERLPYACGVYGYC